MKLQDDSGWFSNFLTSERSSKRRSKFVDRETPGTSESLNMTKTLQEQVDMRRPPWFIEVEAGFSNAEYSQSKEHFQCISLNIRNIVRSQKC